MHSRRAIARSIILTPIVAAASFLISGEVVSVREPAGPARLIAFERLPEPDAAMCEFEPTLDAAVAAFEASQSAPGQEAGASDKGERAGVAARKPLRMIQDPYAGFNAVAVDPIRSEVVLMDEFHFNAFVYDRLANTPPSAQRTEPKRVIGGLKTKSQYGSDVYVDPKNGDIYIINNDSVPGLKVFSRRAQGDAAPDRELETPYGAFGIAVDEDYDHARIMDMIEACFRAA